MRIRKTFAPMMEEAERRLLLTAGVEAEPMLYATTAEVSHHSHARKVHLAGTVSGTYTLRDQGMVTDVGNIYDVNGSGTVKGLGQTTVSGSLNATGFLIKGRATGQLTLTTPSGTVVLELKGPIQRGFSPLPSTFRYKIVSGTGNGAKLSDHGVLKLTMTESPPGGQGSAGGQFSIKFRSDS